MMYLVMMHRVSCCWAVGGVPCVSAGPSYVCNICALGALPETYPPRMSVVVGVLVKRLSNPRCIW